MARAGTRAAAGRFDRRADRGQWRRRAHDRRARRIRTLNILALDAALGPFSAALAAGASVWSARSDRNDALEAGLARVAELLDRAGLTLAELDRIAVGLGPGSFTGIRIALSFAKALAYGANLPLVGISSYDVLTPADAAEPCLTLVSGRPGTLCARLRDAGSDTLACGPSADVIARLLAGRDPAAALTVIAATPGIWLEIGSGGPGQIRSISPAARDPAAAIARLARERRPADTPHGLAPDYGEVPAVTMPKAGTKSER